MDEQNMVGLTDVILDRAPPQTPDPQARARKAWQVRAKSGPFAVDPEVCYIWPGNTRDVAALTSPSFLDLRESLKSAGQKMPVVARISSREPERLEIIAGACRLTAIRQINEECQDGDQMQVLVDLRELDDKAALMIVDAENRGRSDMSVLEKARFYQGAIERVYYAENVLAEALGLNKSTVNRTLAILKLPPDLFGIIKDPHNVGAKQASEFMSDWGEPRLQDALSEAIADLVAAGPATAASVFKALRHAIEPPSQEACAEILHEGAGVGSLRRGKAGVTIKLLPSADGIVLKPLVISIGNALKEIGFK
jgi:ParB/RepB/Spo0J family partition protein